MSAYEMPRVCMGGHGAAYLERLTHYYRGFIETSHIGDMEVWRCPVCGAVYVFPERNNDE